MKHNYLAAGIIYCAACKTRMKAISTNNGYRRKNGTKKIYYLYRCGTYENRSHDEGCAKNILASTIDDQLWTKVWGLISDSSNASRSMRIKQ
jgi:hypothetical protein